MEFKLVYMLVGESPKEVKVSYDELMAMVANMDHGKVLSVKEA